MMRFIFSISILFITLGVCVGQDDDTIQYIQGLPETGERSDRPPHSPDEIDASQLIKALPGDLPAELLKELDKDDLFHNWRDHPVFFDRKLKLYRIETHYRESKRFYILNRDGKVISIQEESETLPETK
jgi:hypothetical protein